MTPPGALCPGRQQLERLSRGKIPYALVEPLARHLEQCDSCLRTFQALQNEDTLAEVLRQHAATRVTDPDPRIEGLIERLRNLKGPAADATASEAATVAPASAADAEAYAFLAPPQQPDERGRLGPYRVLKVLGTGGMGVVFLAEDPQLRRKVALKVMKPALAGAADRKRFLREAQVAASIKHDHIVTIYQVGEDRGAPFLAMEFLEGTSLDDWLKNGQQPTLEQVLRIGRETVQGLAAAHARGLIHRDIKPANLWLEALPGEPGGSSPRYCVKILDFGLARLASGGSQLTEQGAIVGTPAFMAPEQASDTPVDARCDLFSLGCVLYRLCAGRVPFQGAGAIDVLVRVCTETPPRVDQLDPLVPPALADLIGRLMEKDPNKRPPSAQAVIEDLRAIERELAANTAPQAAGGPRPGASGGRPRRWPWVAVAAALVLVGGVLLGQVLVRIRDKDGKVVSQTPLPPGGTVEIVPNNQSETAGSKGIDVGWVERVRKLPPAEQVEAVRKRLQQCNPDFDGTFEPKTENGVVRELKIRSNSVQDLSPVRALAGLKVLHCWGNTGLDGKGKGTLTDLSPLKGLALTELNVGNNAELADLAPLKDMPLEVLAVHGTRVSDLAPLQDLKLWKLTLSGSWVSDLRPVRAAPLRYLNITNTRVSDLKPLRDLPLRTLYLTGAPVNDLSVLKQFPLRDVQGDFETDAAVAVLRPLWALQTINDRPAVDFWARHDPQHAAMLRWIEEAQQLRGEARVAAVLDKLKERNPDFDGRLSKPPKLVTPGEVTEIVLNTDRVEDLAPLRAFPRLGHLEAAGSYPRKGALADLTPLVGLPLVHLDLRETRVSDLTPLRHLPLRHLDVSESRVKDLSPLRGKRLMSSFRCYYTAVEDLTPLEGMPLLDVNVGGCRFASLAPLHGMPLVKLACKQTRVKDLTPLEGTPLQWLECTVMVAPDFTPLRKTPIREIFCDRPERQTATLSLLWSLEKINGQPAVEFFRKNNPDHAAILEWIAATRQLPADQQLAQVQAKLKERNPGLDGDQVKGQIEGGKVLVLSVPAAELTDLVPVRALPDLQVLSCTGTADRRGRLSDLSPLAGLRGLTKLYVSHTAVSDLAPLAGLGLRFLHCDATAVHDLAPLKRMRLEDLGCDAEVARGNRALLHGVGTLKAINHRPAGEIWKELDAAKP
jgi:Leucine-rich repeat (LRR) protein/tRNA A-37 threonylcarbamoyl transferase component Bud32